MTPNKVEVVIKLSKQDYELVCKYPCKYPQTLLGTFAEAVSKGTPLPEGHGRIGDLDALEEEMANGIKAGNFEEGYEEYEHINNVDDCLECVRYADTIIEADKTGKQDHENNHDYENDDYYRGAQEER